MSKIFYSLRFPNFRLWFTGSMFASSATWMQRIAQDWLVLTVLTDNNGTQLGIVTALQFLPSLLFAPWGGAIADRVERRRIIQTTQTLTGLCGLILGLLIWFGYVQLWHVFALAFFAGCCQAVDSPSRQAFVSELVPAAYLPNGVALNSMAFNVARLIGPAMAGLVVEWVGIAQVFFINTLLFAVPVTLMMFMRRENFQPQPKVPREKHRVWQGFSYVGKRPDIVMILVAMGVISAFGLNFQIFSALMATEVYGMEAGEFGFMSTCQAVGAIIGALAAARREHPRLRLILMFGLGFGLFLGCLALAPTYYLYLILSVPMGFFSISVITTANGAVQISTDPHMRGRVMAIYTMVFLGVTPLGSPMVGWIADMFGARWSLGVGAIGTAGVVVLIGLWCVVRYHYRLQVDQETSRLTLARPADRVPSGKQDEGEPQD